MAFSQLQSVMATLRISLAEIQNKESQLDALVNQFRTQLRRLPRQVLYGKTGLDSSLSAMGEIDERLEDALATRRRVLAIKKSALEELQALELVKQVDEARHTMQSLHQKARSSGEDAEGENAAEINRLEAFIAEHSKRAEQAITMSYEERHSPE